jgi:hypothetical protein
MGLRGFSEASFSCQILDVIVCSYGKSGKNTPKLLQSKTVKHTKSTPNYRLIITLIVLFAIIFVGLFLQYTSNFDPW